MVVVARSVVCVVVSVGLAAPVFAQGGQSEITGTVSDQAKAVCDPAHPVSG